MEFRMTPAIRLVCSAVNEAIGPLPKGSFNYGLYFNKWFYVVDGTGIQDTWKRGKKWACSLKDETAVEKRVGKNEYDICPPNPLLDNLEISLALFNGDKYYEREIIGNVKGVRRLTNGTQKVDSSWNRSEIQSFLQMHHAGLERCAEAFKKLRYEYYKEEVCLLTPLVVGLGNEHPTEKGFRFDWTLGIPVISSSSIKGVVRLAYLVEQLNQYPDQKAAEEFWDEIIHDKLKDSAQNLFGCGEGKAFESKVGKIQIEAEFKKQVAQRSKVIFLDAYPATLPRLKPEIMNCHYPDYFKGKRGPTEDQQPNPQKYWAVDPYLDKQGTPLKFIFRFLLHKDIASNQAYREGFEKALKAALEEHGLGAKTAIGHGRFSQKFRVSDSQPSTSVGERVKEEISLSTSKPGAQTGHWDQATLTWNPGNMTLTATSGSKKATCKGKDLVPEIFHKKIFEKKKSVTARVEVEPVGNAFKIIKIES